MDRFTWGFAIGGVALCVVALATVFLARATPPPSLSTPAGVVTAYIQAVRERDADRAWSFLAPGAVGPAPSASRSAGMSRTEFDRELTSTSGSNSSSRRIRVLDTTDKGETARVNVEVTQTSGGPPLFGSDSSRTLTFSLKQVDGQWRIDTAPSVYEIG